MKRILIYLILICVVIANIYLIFFWQPQGKGVSQPKDSQEVVSYSKSVYKLEKGKVLEKLSSGDKKDLEKIIKKLSTFDMGKIKEYYEELDDEEGAINIFTLLKKRLTVEDYERIHEISASFLDFNSIEKKIKNN
jgi:hypothetical protein